MAVAASCVVALVVVLGLGVGAYLLLGRDGRATASPTASEPVTEDPDSGAGSSTGDSGSSTADPESGEPDSSGSAEPAGSTTTFEVVSPTDEIPGSADDLREVMRTNPLTTGTFTTIPECELPGTPVEASVDELQTTLSAAGHCLDQVWANVSSDRNLPWTSPRIVVYDWPDIPDSACDPDSFEEDLPRACTLDSTIYWPRGYGITPILALSGELDDEDEISSSYLWDLSYMYMTVVMWNSSVGTYYQSLLVALGDDTDAQDEAWRRYSLQATCLASAAILEVPEAQRPSQEVRDILEDPESWNDTAVTAGARTHWITAGFGSDGELAVCNTWEAPSDQVI